MRIGLPHAHLTMDRTRVVSGKRLLTVIALLAVGTVTLYSAAGLPGLLLGGSIIAGWLVLAIVGYGIS